MIYNYALTHYCCESAVFEEKTFQNLVNLFQKTRDENIILIIDKNKYLIDCLLKGLKSYYKTSSDEYSYFTEILLTLDDKNKIYRHDFIYDENNVKEFIESIKSSGIIIDAIIVDKDEENTFKNAIPIEKFSLEHQNDKERITVNKNGINLIDHEINSLDTIYQRIVWDSVVFKYYDYNLGNGTFKTEEIRNLDLIKNNSENESSKWKIFNNDITSHKLRQINKFKLGFQNLIKAIKSISKKIKKEKNVLIEVFTPQPLKNLKSLNAEDKIKNLQQNLLMLQLLDEKICSEIQEENISLKIYFYDSLLDGKSKYGSAEHNRLFFSLSSNQIDVAKGLDIYDLKTKEIQQGKWRFLGSKEDTQQDISNRNPLDIKKYKENIEHYLGNL